MSTEVGSAYVAILPSVRGFSKALEKEVGPGVRDAGKRSGKAYGGMFATASAGPLRGMVKMVGGPLLGAFAAVAGVKVFTGFIEEARESQKIGRLTAQVIKSTGGAAKITAEDVGNLAESIAAKTGIDDEAIQSGANLLLTFANVRNEAGKGNDIFNQTTAIMADMSAALGKDAKGSAIQLGKALNDPIKGISALSRAGVSFTAQQKEQIKTLVESGDTLGAQKVILAELGKEFGGAAEAAADPLAKLQVIVGNLGEDIGSALLPMVDRVATWLSARAIPAVVDFGRQVRTRVTSPLRAVVRFVRGTVLPALEELRTKLAGYGKRITAALGKVDLSGLTAGFTSGGEVSASSFVEGLRTKLAGLDWGQVGRTVGEGIATALSKAAEVAVKLTAALGELIAKVNWGDLAFAVGKQGVVIALGLATGLLNFDMGSLFRFVVDHWWEVLIGILSVAFAPLKLVGLLAKIPVIGPALGWLLGALRGMVRPVVNAVGRFLGSALGAFGRGFASAFPKIGGELSKWLRLIPTRIGLAALEVREAVVRFIIRMRAGFLAGVEQVGEAVGRILVRIGSVLGRGFVTLVTAVGRGVVRVITALVNAWLRGITLVLSAVNRLTGGLSGRLVEGLTRAARAAADNAARIILSIVKAIHNGVGQTWDAVKGIGSAIINAAADFGSLLYHAGRDLIQGLVNGIKDMAGAAADAVGNAAKGAVDRAKGIFQWNSPSKVFRDMGEGVVEGFVLGVVKQTPRSSAAVTAMADGAVTAASTISIPGMSLAAAGLGRVPVPAQAGGGTVEPVVQVFIDGKEVESAVTRVADRRDFALANGLTYRGF